MQFELIMAVVIIPFNGCLLDRAIHALDLSIRPRVSDFCQALFDFILKAAQIEHVVHVG